MKTSYKIFASFALFLTFTVAVAQHSGKHGTVAHLNEALRYELLHMRDEIIGLQRNRFAIEKKYGTESTQYQKATLEIAILDNEHKQRIIEIVTTNNWPTFQMVGKDGAEALWMIVYRMDKDVLKICAPLMTKAARANEADKYQAAVLQDKALISNGKKQWFGTQLYANSETGKLEIFPIADESNLDARRKEMNLEPLTDYLSKNQKQYYGSASQVSSQVIEAQLEK